ncbi:MAG: GNAT family N-acetyltransferase [Thomasclavelia sp.]|nr:GNAT family N-acetyltransferase [Thomasclavelia sp.]
MSEALVEDAKDIIEYLKLVGSETNNLTFGKDIKINEFEEASFIQEIIDSEKNVMLLGFVEDKIVSVGSLTTSSSKRLDHHTNLGISVLKEYWHMGIGKMMVEELIDYAKNHKIEIIDLEVKADNVNAISLYKKLGFKEFGYYKDYFKIDNEYFDAVYMSLYL